MEKLEAESKRLRDNIAKRGIRRGRDTGATTLMADIIDSVHLAAIEMLKSGAKGIAAAREVLTRVLGERPEGSPEVSRSLLGEASREAARVAREAGPEGEKLEEAMAASAARHTSKDTETVKQAVARTTGTAPEPKTVTEPAALKATMKAQERAAAEGFKAGQQAERAKAEAPKRETIKQRIARITGTADTSGDSGLTNAQAMALALKREARGARIAEKAERERMNEVMAAKLEELRQDAYAETLKQAEKAGNAGYRQGQADKQAIAVRAAKLIRQFAPPERVKKYLGFLARADQESDVENLVNRLLLDLADYRQKQAKDEAQKVIKKAKPKEMTEDIRKEFLTAKRDLGSILADLSNKSAAIALQIDKVRENIKDPAERARQIGDLMGRRAEVLNDARREIVGVTQKVIGLRQAQRHFQEVLVNGKTMQRVEVAEELKANLAKVPNLVDTRRVKEDAESPWYKRLYRLGDNRETMAAILGDGKFGSMLTTAIYEGERKMMADEVAGEQARRAAVEAAGFAWGSPELRRLSAKAEGQRAELVKLNLPSGQTFEATPAEIGELYAILTDDDARGKILGGTPVKLQRTENSPGNEKGITLTRDDVRYIERTVDPKIRQIVDALKADFEKRVSPGERAAFREHFGYDMPRWGGYWTTRRRPEQQTPTGLIDEWNQSGPASLARTSMWKERVENPGKAPYLIGDVFNTHAKMIRDSAARTHLNQPVRSLHAVMRDADVQRIIKQKFGLTFYKQLALKAEESAVILRTAPDANNSGPVLRIVSTVQRNLSRAFLSVSPSAVLKNIGGTFKLGNYIDTKYLIEAARDAAADVASKSIEKRMMEGSAFLADRHGHNAAQASAAMLGETSDLLGELSSKDLAKRLISRETLGKQSPGDVGKLIDALPFFAWGDARPSVVAWRAAELQVEAEQPTLKGKAKTAAVAAIAENAVRLSQNPHTTISAAYLHGRWRGTLAAPLLQFTSDGIQSLNMLRQAAIRHGVKSKEFARAATAVGLNNAWSAAVTAALSNTVPYLAAVAAGNTDDDEFRKGRRSFASTFARELAVNTAGLFYFGPQAYEMGEQLYNSMTGGPTRGGDVAITPMGRVASDAVATLIQAGKTANAFATAETEEQYQKAYKSVWATAERMATTGTPLLGLPVVPPYSLVKRAVRGATDAADPSTAYKAAADRLRGGEPEAAADIVHLVMRQAEPGKKLAAFESARDALYRLGPDGSMTVEERIKLYKALDPAKREERQKAFVNWRRQVDAAVKDAAARKK